MNDDPYDRAAHEEKLHAERSDLVIAQFERGLDEIEAVRLRAVRYELDRIETDGPMGAALDRLEAFAESTERLGAEIAAAVADPDSIDPAMWDRATAWLKSRPRLPPEEPWFDPNTPDFDLTPSVPDPESGQARQAEADEPPADVLRR